MSSTNRGAKRKPYDFYITPKEVVENMLNHIDLNEYGDRILEPSAGNGSICRCLKEHFPSKTITALEIREEEQEVLKGLADNVVIGDFFAYDTNNKYDIIIGNPPYSDAMGFVDNCLKMLSDDGVLILLLRTAFLESKSRYEFWQRNPLSRLYTLSRRPSFTGTGTDSSSYSWFIWDKSTAEQMLKVI